MSNEAFGVGGGTSDTLANVKIGAAAVTAINRYMTFESPVGTDYQVQAGKTLIITQVDVWSGSAVFELALGYGDDGVADGVAAPTTYLRMAEPFKGLLADNYYQLKVTIPIPALKFPVLFGTNAPGSCTFFGIEI